MLASFSDVNVQPDPVKFVQLTTKYWEPFGEMRPGWMNLPYVLPDGCKIANVTGDPDFAAKVCAADSLNVNVTAGEYTAKQSVCAARLKLFLVGDFGF